MCDMERIGLTASEEMSFENVDRQTPDACIYYEGRSRSNRTSAITIVHVYRIKNNVYEMKAMPFIDKSA